MKILVLQTAFLGDVVLATPLIEKLHRFYPEAELHFLLRKGNEGLLKDHPFLHRCWVWDKKTQKYAGLWRMLRAIRRERFDVVVNCQRFAAAGFLTVFSGARHTVGFDKNPLARFFSRRFPHQIGTGQHEVERNLSLIEALTDTSFQMPRLYPGEQDYAKVSELVGAGPYVCMAPNSVWFTKQWPAHKWLELIERIPATYTVCLLGAPGDFDGCESIRLAAAHPDVRNLAGKLNLLQSAALMAGAGMNYVNDSAPLHLASAMNAPVAAVFCSTVPDFGFGPLSTDRFLVESTDSLSCRPCGLHGHRACPKGHFDCAEGIYAAQFPLP
ncbi:MAG: glycosyltransferase family 9 protein [Saprospiraceae bacterium]